MTEDSNTLALPKHAWSGIEEVGKDQFVSKHLDFTTNKRFYAGHLISQALYCAYKTVPVGFDINSFHSYFVKSGSSKVPITINVKRIRDGRNFVFRVVQLLQNDQAIYHCEFTFRKRPEKSDLKITQASFPSVPQPEKLKSVFELRDDFKKQGYGKRESHGVAFREIIQNLEIRPCNGMEYVLGPQRPTLKQNIWVRYKPENVQKDIGYNCLAVAFISDVGLAYTGAMPFPKTAFRVFSSLDHSGWLHEPRFDPSEYMLFEQECLMHTNGKSLVHGRLWTRNGDLIASVSQEALVEKIQPIKPLINSKL